MRYVYDLANMLNSMADEQNGEFGHRNLLIVLILRYIWCFKFCKMSWWLVILILFVGWLLVFLEVFFIPGITLFAAIGTMTMIAGVVFSFSNFGVLAGTLTLVGTAVFTFLSIVVGYKTGVFNGLTLRDTVKGKMNEIDTALIKVGDSGIALSKISFIGKGLFNDATYEVQSMGEYIEEGQPIEVIKISMNKIFIKQKS